MKFSITKVTRTVLLLIILCLAAPAIAQKFSQQNFSNVKVDDLTDEQIQSYLKEAKASGLTEDQLIQMAEAKGMRPGEIDKLKARIAKMEGQGQVKGQTQVADTTQGRKLNNAPQDTSIQKQETPDQKAAREFRARIFGASLFSNSNLTFEPNLRIATPKNYIIGPDDEIRIDLTGDNEASYKLTVSPEGTIHIEYVGIVMVSGLSIEQATQKISSKLASTYPSIKSGRTKVTVALGNIRSIKVTLVGEAEKPGSYTLPSLATAFNALYVSGGPTVNGSFRNIEIIRGNRVIERLDIYDFLLKGFQKNNIHLQDQDVIRVPAYKLRTELNGEVKHPAIFEMLPDETLADMISFAGGFTDVAYTARISVLQNTDRQHKIADIYSNQYSTYKPQAGDKYFVEPILDRFENRVIIKGAVFRPGQFELQKGLTLSQLIEEAAGLKEDAFTGRGNITRLKPDNTTELIPFDVHAIMKKSDTDIPLQREDIINIFSIFDLREKYKVTINGEVRKPGEFAYADSMSVEDLIINAGGFNHGASSKRIEVARRVLNSDPQSKNRVIANVFIVDVNAQLNAGDAGFKLQPFDIVSVYSLLGYQAQNTVKVEGEVLYPGSYTIQKKNEKISDLIARAGGLTAWADIEGGTLRRANSTILGADKGTKIDTAELAQERLDRIKRLEKTNKDSLNTQDIQPRNDYVGIDLKKILDKPGSNIDLIVEDGDIIRIPKEQQIVRVNGEVLYPSAVVYDNYKSFNDYVLNAGGFSANALKKGAYIVYPNGTVKGTRKFLFFKSCPIVKPGSEIYVPKKPEVTAMKATETVALATGVASLGAIVLAILNILKL